ncbi:MAG: glycosyltransferase family 4 protein [Bacteroidia bacterium]|nr:glycosyltransferase family 4 protein [Bacteroidia bacterium]MDW8235744.1 glycosyltransferase family 4 protein [Bacteroidia bacterium]
MRLLVMAAGPISHLPNLRFRFLPYLPYLAKEGYRLDFQPFLTGEEYEQFYRLDASYLSKAIIVSRATLRLFRAPSPQNYQGFIVAREATFLGTSYLERRWAAHLPMLLDFDDAIWLPAVSAQNRLFRWLKNPRKIHTLLSLARAVLVCNEFLAAYARHYHDKVYVIPTIVDTQRFQPILRSPRPYVVIGWTGSPTTAPYLHLVENVLAEIHRMYRERVRFLLIGAMPYQPPFPAQVVPWSSEREVRLLQEIDIGIMPLPEDEWSRGKCALKAIQYMAVGIPSVVSPVGMNREVIQEGQTGFFASTPEEWITQLRRLIEDPDLRQRMGRAARQTAEKRYSAPANFPYLLSILRDTFGSTTPS